MLEKGERKQLEELIGNEKLAIFDALSEYIINTYDIDYKFKELKYVSKQWPAKYEFKFSKGRKTFCGFYFAEDKLGLTIIFGKDERKKVEEIRSELSSQALEIYDGEEPYHDGKWVLFELEDLSLVEDIKKLLLLKRKPKKL